MDLQLPVIWTLNGTTSSGRADVSRDRFELTSRHRAFAFPLGSVVAAMIERSPARRVRGLPALSLRLAGGDVVYVASMGGPGSLRDLASAVADAQACESGT
jgi:hypothetical protein